jgi:citrate lyase alpha subunit
MIFGREPAVWIGIIVSVVLAVVTTLQGQGVISDALAGHVTDATNALAQILVLVAPLIAGVLIRSQVTPANPPAQ